MKNNWEEAEAPISKLMVMAQLRHLLMEQLSQDQFVGRTF